MDDRLVPLRASCSQPLESAAGEPEGRPAARQVDDLHVAPEHPWLMPVPSALAQASLAAKRRA